MERDQIEARTRPVSHHRAATVTAWLTLLWLAIGAAQGTPRTDVTFIGSDNSGRQAIATFEIDGGNLVITFANSASSDVLHSSAVLSGLFFDISGARVHFDQKAPGASVVLSPSSTLLFGGHTDPLPPGSVGGEWAYDRHGRGDDDDRDGDDDNDEDCGHRGAYGVGSASLGFFGKYDRFPGSNLYGPKAPDGLAYGLTSAGDDPSTGSNAVTGHKGPLIKNGVVITLPGLPATFDLASILNVGFQYGTSCEQPFIRAVPEPSMLLFFGGGAGFFFRNRRRYFSGG